MKSKESGAGSSGLCVHCPPSHVLLNLICYLQAAAVTAESSSKHELVWVVLGTVRNGLGQQS